MVIQIRLNEGKYNKYGVLKRQLVIAMSSQDNWGKGLEDLMIGELGVYAYSLLWFEELKRMMGGDRSKIGCHVYSESNNVRNCA